MGTDNLFHKRKARKNQRKTAYRQEYDKVLIVCEGEKTEPFYFKELINHYKISSANVKVDGSCGSSPKCVFFNYSTKPYSNKGNSSIANEVLKDLKQYLPNYEKGTKDIFNQAQKALKFAINNAKRSLDQATKNNTDNPSTNVHELVEYLKNLKRKI